MFHFYFNDCIPNTANEYSLINCLIRTLQEYNSVKKDFFDDVDGIVTSSSIDKLILNRNDSYSLSTCVAAIPDKSFRTLAYTLFTKYPIEKYFSDIDEEDLLKNDYTLTIDKYCHSAINAVIVSMNNGILFTLPLHQDLQKNTLTINSNLTTTIDVNNLYGDRTNTIYIKDLIKNASLSNLSNFDQLLQIIGDNSYSERFKKSFECLSTQVQESIIHRFEAAKSRNGITPFYADDDIIKDVTGHGIRFKIFELRVFKPVPFRVYFSETPNKTYLAMIEKKPADKKQDIHIDNATSIISQMRIMGN
jgi:hypothetical protein